MTEAAFPVLGAAFVMLVVLPAAALLVKAALVVLEQGLRVGHCERYDYATFSSQLRVPSRSPGSSQRRCTRLNLGRWCVPACSITKLPAFA